MKTAPYEEMKRNGRTAAEVHRAVLNAGESRLAAMKVLHDVFRLDAAATKEVMLMADGEAESINEHEGRLAEDIGAVLSQEATQGRLTLDDVETVRSANPHARPRVIGIVEAVFATQGGIVIAVQLKERGFPVTIGSTLRFGESLELRVVGLKFWPEKDAVDLICASNSEQPSPGDVVCINPPDMLREV